MRETTCAVKVFLIASNGVSIGNNLIYAAMLHTEHILHLLVGELGCDVDSPVAEAEEELLCILVAALEPCVAQTGIHLMDLVERNPCGVESAEIAFLEC